MCGVLEELPHVGLLLLRESRISDGRGCAMFTLVEYTLVLYCVERRVLVAR